MWPFFHRQNVVVQIRRRVDKGLLLISLRDGPGRQVDDHSSVDARGRAPRDNCVDYYVESQTSRRLVGGLVERERREGIRAEG